MNINWKLRLQNRTTLLALFTAVIGLLYQVLKMFNIVPYITEDELMTAFKTLVSILMILGIVVDPTTAGISDSKTAMEYEVPKED